MKAITEMPEGYQFYMKNPINVKAIQMQEAFKVQTLEGTLKGKAGDYLIEGVRGELYPCDKNIFEETYTGPYNE